ncbi:MAG: YggU family protein [Deltaproteobacteria bacterium]|nr:YggU family protein [Deltaproteobacteria bacterium]
MLDVLIAPRASRNRIMGVHDNRLKIQLTAPPVDGKANDALIRFLAESLAISRAQIEIVGGATNRRKTVRLSGIPSHLALLKLSPPAAE